MENGEQIFGRLKAALTTLADEHGISDEKIRVTARTLSPQETIGNPGAGDYPLVKGKERMIEAVFREAKGQAFTDMFGDWNGSISDLAHSELSNNFRRAVFVASLNAISSSLGIIKGTVHCRDDGPVRCGEECLQMLRRENPEAHILLVGHQPRLLEHLRSSFQLSVVDRDKDNIGKDYFGITILSPEATEHLIDHVDILLVTGTTLVNGTISQFLNRKAPVIFYGVTIAAAAQLLGWRRFCPFGL